MSLSALPWRVARSVASRSRILALRTADGVRAMRYGMTCHEGTLRTIESLSKRRTGLSVCLLPTEPWFGGGFQRPHQLARALADQGVDVLYSERWHRRETNDGTEVVAELASERRFLGLKTVQDRIHVLHCPPSYVHSCIHAMQPDLLLMSWPTQAKFISPACRSLVAYEMIDDHSLVAGSNESSWTAAHKSWVKNADIVMASADNLHQSLIPARPDALLVPNAVQLEDWISGDCEEVPPDLVEARKAKVVVGYFGALASWFDAEMWFAAAAARPQWSFVLIGCLYDAAGYALAERAKSHKNVYYLKVKPYHQLRAYLRHFDVATIPFVLNPITHSCSPVKLFEYMAAGKPVVATRMAEIEKYQSVLFADESKSFIDQIENAVRAGADQEYLECLRTEATANTWSQRVSELLTTMTSTKDRQKGVPRRFSGSNAPAHGRIASAAERNSIVPSVVSTCPPTMVEGTNVTDSCMAGGHMKCGDMKVTVAICTWNRARLLNETLQSLSRIHLPGGVPWEVIVVDNNSTDGTAAVLNTWRTKLPLRTLFEATPGQTHARNTALAHATGDLVIWTDDDVLVTPQWLAAYVEAAKQWPEAAFFGGSIEPLFDVPPPDWIKANLEALQGVLVIRQLGEDVRPLKPGERPFGANMAFRRSAIVNHWFDTSIGHCAGRLLGGDDLNYVDALVSEGRWGVWVGAAKVAHHVPAERMTVAFLRRWCDDAGMSCARQTFGHGLPELLGLPRWHMRRYVETGCKLLTARLLRNTNWVTPFIQHRVLGAFLSEWRVLNLDRVGCECPSRPCLQQLAQDNRGGV